VFLAGKKKKVRRNKNAAGSSRNASSRSQAAAAAQLSDAELVGLFTKLPTSTSHAGLLLHHLWSQLWGQSYPKSLLFMTSVQSSLVLIQEVITKLRDRLEMKASNPRQCSTGGTYAIKPPFS